VTSDKPDPFTARERNQLSIEADRVAELLLAHDRRILTLELEFHSAAMWAKFLGAAGVTVLAAILASNLLHL
jgi:hypothetical protein